MVRFFQRENLSSVRFSFQNGIFKMPEECLCDLRSVRGVGTTDLKLHSRNMTVVAGRSQQDSKSHTILFKQPQPVPEDADRLTFTDVEFFMFRWDRHCRIVLTLHNAIRESDAFMCVFTPNSAEMQ